MKSIFCSALLLLSFFAGARAQEPVPLAHGNVPGESNHHLKIENEYVRVYYVEVPPHEATQLHQHDYDYIYVSLGPSDVVNAIVNKPEIHLQFKDGETHFTRGGFAHIARNLADTPFRNITIELLKPQGEPHNWCDEVVPNAPTDCRESSHEGTKMVSSFRTEEIKVFSEILDPKASSKWNAFSPILVVALDQSQIRVSFDKQTENLSADGILWIPGRSNHEVRKVVFVNQQKGISRLLMILFEGEGPKRFLTRPRGCLSPSHLQHFSLDWCLSMRQYGG